MILSFRTAILFFVSMIITFCIIYLFINLFKKNIAKSKKSLDNKYGFTSENTTDKERD